MCSWALHRALVRSLGLLRFQAPQRAEAEARATQMVSEAIAKGDVQAINYFVANSYMKVLEGLAKGDLVIVEGYKRDDHPKIEAWRAETGQPLIATDDPTVRAIASNSGVSGRLFRS